MRSEGCHRPCHVIAKVEWRYGELLPCVGSIIQTNRSWRSERVVRFYNGCGNAAVVCDDSGTHLAAGPPAAAIINECVHSDGDPLSLATQSVGNVAHGRVVTVTIRPFQGHLPVRQPIGKRAWEAVVGMVLNAPKSHQTGVAIISETTQYASDPASFLGQSVLHYHSMQNLRLAVSGQSRFPSPIRPGFEGL